MTVTRNLVIKATRTYSRHECCEIFGWRNKKCTFEYFRYRRKANFVLGPYSHRTSRSVKYHITGLDLYKFIRSWRPQIVPLLTLKK